MPVTVLSGTVAALSKPDRAEASRPRYHRRVRYAEQAPCPALRPYVEAYWTLDAGAGTVGHRVLPDGCIDLLFEGASARVIGPMTRAIVAPAAAGAAPLFGVRFHPGEAAPFLGIAAREVRDRAVLLEDVWGSGGRAIQEAAASAATGEARVRAVERVLLARLFALPAAKSEDRAGARVRGSVAALRASAGRLGVEDLADRLGVGPRTLERLFDERVGLGPKLLARVVRFQRVVATLDGAGLAGGSASWSALAADLCFADQAHLVREVGELAGATPTELLRERRAVSDSFNTGATPAATVPPSPIVSGRR
jgi:AraC-like DNA-binding protein